MHTVELDYGLTTAAGKTLTSLTLRRPKVRDMKNAQRNGGTDAEHEIALLAAMSQEQLTPEDIEELDMADYAKVQAMFRRMLGSDSNHTPSRSATSEVVSVSTE